MDLRLSNDVIMQYLKEILLVGRTECPADLDFGRTCFLTYYQNLARNVFLLSINLASICVLNITKLEKLSRKVNSL